MNLEGDSKLKDRHSKLEDREQKLEDATQRLTEFYEDEIKRMDAVIKQSEEGIKLREEVTRRKEELKKEMEELNKRKEEDKKRREEYRKWREEIEQGEEKARKQREELKKRVEEARRDKSVSLLIESQGGLPAVELNTSATPFFLDTPEAEDDTDKSEKADHGKTRKNCADEEMEELHNGSDQQHDVSKGKLTAAVIKKMNESVEDCINKFPLNFMEEDDRYVTSILALQLKDCSARDQKLPNFNAASISRHVMYTLHDVLGCLHLSRYTQYGQFHSIFSMRPDILVVRWLSRLILVVQVDNPGENGSKVVSNKMAAGKAFDHAMGMHQMGIDHPFVCLSTYDHMRIGTLKESSNDIFTKAIDILKKGPIGNKCQGSIMPKISPEERDNLIEIPDDSKQDKCDDKQDGKNGTEDNDEYPFKREIYFSETFDRKSIFQALYFAIACAVISAEKSTNNRNENLVPKEGEQINRCTAFVTRTQFNWTTLKCKATYQLNDDWDERRKVHLLCVLGKGCSGKVYLGSYSNGRMFAVKLYRFDSKKMGSFYGASNTKKKKSKKERAMDIWDAEAGQWKQFYPHLESAIYPGKLNGVPSLAMPYVAPIPVHDRERLLPKVQQELERFARAGFDYKETYLRWWDIGLRKGKDGEEQIIFLDLESLENIEPGTDENALVDEQLEELKKCAEDKYVPVAQEIIHP